eukprot:707992_1
MALFAQLKQKANKVNGKIESPNREFENYLRKKWRDTKCADVHLPKTQFESQDYMELMHATRELESKQEITQQDSKEEHKRVHVVHISDTHMNHKRFKIPYKPNHINILIHSGDFCKKAKMSKKGEIPTQVTQFAKWFEELPHQKKIIIGGNHEIAFNKLSKQQIRDNVFHSSYYLQDDAINLFGVVFYGSPWTSSRKMGFSANRDILTSKWQAIPNDTDILVTHMPPFGIMDAAHKTKYQFNEKCTVCNYMHPQYKHWGNLDLKNEIMNRIKPKVHLFGHVHQCPGHETHGHVMFINSAMDAAHKTKYQFNEKCTVCNYMHPQYKHWGNLDLKNEIMNRIKPKVHLFGHVHQCPGHETHGHVMFINSAMDLVNIAHEFDIVFDENELKKH